MRAYAPQGEQRSAVVCLKMALLEYLEARRGDRPLLGLADVLRGLTPAAALVSASATSGILSSA